MDTGLAVIDFKWFEHGEESNGEGTENNEVHGKHLEGVPHDLDDAYHGGSHGSEEQEPSEWSEQGECGRHGEDGGADVDRTVAGQRGPVIRGVWGQHAEGDRHHDLSHSKQ